ncbi:MAG: archaellin/type IV pilin N-terminal domain-containing protein, partial [Thermocladium sp.]
MASKLNNRRGISNVVATIILIAVAIALAVAVAVWVFGLAGSSAKTATLQITATGLSNITSSNATLSFLVSNPTSTGVGINGFTLGNLVCTLTSPIQIPAGTTGASITFYIPIKGSSNGVSVFETGSTVGTVSGTGPKAIPLAI